MRTDTIAREIASLARDEVRDSTRVVKMKVLLTSVSILFAIIAAIFFSLGCFWLLRDEIGDVLAAFLLAVIGLLICLICLLSARHVSKRRDIRSRAEDAQRVFAQASSEVKAINPYLLLGAFVLGVWKGRK